MTKNKKDTNRSVPSFLDWFQLKLNYLYEKLEQKKFSEETKKSFSSISISDTKTTSSLNPISETSPLFSLTENSNFNDENKKRNNPEKINDSSISKFSQKKEPNLSQTQLTELRLNNSSLSPWFSTFPKEETKPINNTLFFESPVSEKPREKNKWTNSIIRGNTKSIETRDDRDKFNGKSFLKKTDIKKQQVVSITYEEIGLFPRSFNRVFDRFFKQLFFDVENLVIQEYRFYRYLFLTTVKCLCVLIFVPFFVNFICKNYIVRPITEYYWNAKQPEIFLNTYQQKRAFSELKNFEEKIYFESLIVNAPALSNNSPNSSFHNSDFSLDKSLNFLSETSTRPLSSDISEKLDDSSTDVANVSLITNRKKFDETVQKLFQRKTLELAHHYNEESIEAITNFFADLISLSTLCFLLFNLEIQINITKSFLLEVFFGLDDSKKSLLILFVTDLLVGYHSPNIWELFFSSLFDHYGLPESQTTIFLLVATLPVLLDVLFKYLIFRHLNRASPATVATYHAMIE